MKKPILSMYFLFCLMPLSTSMVPAQNTKQLVGHPDRRVDLDVLPGFQNPPMGYGEVPFYWWLGDTLTHEHLIDHLDLLAGNGVSSLQINYAHSDKGGKSWGLTYPSKPALFTEDWWNLFGWFMKEAKKRNMTVSLSDYTLGVGQEQFVDEALAEHPEIMGAELKVDKTPVSGGPVSLSLKHSPLSVVVYRVLADQSLDEQDCMELTSKVQDQMLSWEAPQGRWLVVQVYAQKKNPSFDPMHPESGKVYIRHFFQKFEDRFPEESKGGLNFFFSDELNFQLNGYIWNDYFQNEFKRRKGYDIVPHLAALFENVGGLTAKYRLDYNDVMVSLSEEHFFKPVYMWHESRGLIYGCDHGGRGKDVAEFGDYFRTQRWNQGAGCDQPSLNKDVIKNKVASSIAHLYERPRTWLEGFYGSGWDTSSGMLLDALFGNYVQGQNLLSLHGLYYSTPGGWWEWAPPCNHFRMPYWQEMPSLLKCMERLSYLLSQGRHCADVAILYPVEPVIAGDGDRSVKCAFSLGEKLYHQGIDFDFMDYESLARAEVDCGKLSVSGEHYSVLIIPSMKTLRYSTLEKALQFQKAGGKVLCVDDYPEVTDRGVMDAATLQMARSLFHLESLDVPDYIAHHVKLDFRGASDNPSVMHRRIGYRDVYAVYHVKAGTECYFRAKGAVELWDPWNGTTRKLSVTRVDDDGTYVSMPLSETEIQLIVFDSRGKADISVQKEAGYEVAQVLDGKWEFEPIPCLDNKWGDFHWPGTDEKIGPEIREVRYSSLYVPGWNRHAFDADRWELCTLGYGTHFLSSGPLATPLDEQQLMAGADYKHWAPYRFSWRYGVEGDYGHQGYHGLKGEMYDAFIRLGKIQVNGTGMKRVADSQGNHYYLYTQVVAPRNGDYELLQGETMPVSAYLNGEPLDLTQKMVRLKKGENQLLLHYEGPCITYFVFRDKAVEGKYVAQTLAERPISMKWNGDLSMLPMDVEPASAKGFYRFKAAPGLRTLRFTTSGRNLKVWIDGQSVRYRTLKTREDGAGDYEIKVPHPVKDASIIAMELEKGNRIYSQAAAFPYPMKQECGKGLIALGDWADEDGLKFYSGGMWYRKKFSIETLQGNKTYRLDLGDVTSTAEVWVNGKKVGLRMAAPWTFDVTEQLKEGENEVAVKVYNTAFNHYQSIPTQYNKKQKSGITGEVKLYFR